MKNYNKKQINNDGTVVYTLKGEYHRTDGPAIEYADGSKEWYMNGQRHRTENDGPAAEYTNGSKEWYINGQLHRENGPAIEYVDGAKSWYVNGKYHRTDGPAIELVDGRKYWYINGKKYSEKEFNRIINPPNCPEYMKISQQK